MKTNCKHPNCNKPFHSQHPNQLFCSKSCATSYRTISHKPRPATAPELSIQSFINSHPTKQVEILHEECVPNRGIVRSYEPKTRTDLHSVLNTRRVRTLSQED